jgi:hypothetical protein
MPVSVVRTNDGLHATKEGGVMPAWFWVLFWWLLFGGTHIGLSARGVRPSLVARLGLRGFQAV